MIANLGHGGERAGERLLELVLEHQGDTDGGESDGSASDIPESESDETVAAPEPEPASTEEEPEPEPDDSAGEPEPEPGEMAEEPEPEPDEMAEEPGPELTESPDAQDSHFSAGDVVCILLAVLVSTLAVPRPAYAYVDPSVMTYAIQAVAAVAVALSAVLGVAFRKTRSVIFKLLRIDENANRIVEPPVHRIGADQKEQADAEALARREADAAAYRQRQVRVIWPVRLLLSLLAVALPVFTVLVVAPIELVATNASSLVYGVDMIWGPITRVALIAVPSVALVLSLFRGKPFHVLLALTAALGVAAYLEALLFARYLPLADGTPVAWDEYAGITAASAALWLVVLAGSIVLAIRKPSIARTLAAALSLALIVIQAAGIASLSEVTGAGTSVLEDGGESGVTEENYQNVCTELGLFDVSEHDNVIVFVLDMTDSMYIRTMLDGYYPEILDGLEGFTFFENSGGGMVPTRYGIPLLLTGAVPEQGQTLTDYWFGRYANSSVLSDIASLGYSSGLYSTSFSWERPDAYRCSRYTINNHDISESIEVLSASFDEAGALDILYRCALYRDLPWAFKPQFWYYTDDINQGMADTSSEQVEGDDVLYQTDDVVYYQKLSARGLTFNDEQASFRFIHLNGTHWPYTMSRDVRRLDSSAWSWEEQCIGAFEIVKAYLDELRRLGIYDRTTVIITADHGVWHPVDSDELEPIDEPSSAIIFVKPAQTAAEAMQPCRISQAPVTVVDLLPTILEAMGADDQMLASYGPDIYSWNEWDERPRYFYMLDREVTADGGVGVDEGLWEYVINGDAADFENWEFTGNITPLDYTYYQERGLL